MITFSEFSCEFDYLSGAKNRELTIGKSKNYTVYVNGIEAPTYKCRTSANPINQEWRGYQRPIAQSEIHSFVNIIGDESAVIKVKISDAAQRVRIKPYSKNVRIAEKDGFYEFTLTENGYYVLENGDFHDSLFILYGAPVPMKEKPTYYFGKGVHFVGKITMKSGQSVYVDKDAYVYGTLFAENVENIEVYGNGIFDGGTEERVCGNAYEKFINGNLKIYDCKNVSVRGVGFVNSAIWCVNLYHCFNVNIDGVKVFGQWRYNTDGIDIVNSQNVTVKNSLFQSFDDSIVLKGIERYKDTDCAHVLIENCVVQCDWGKTLEVGLETRCNNMYDITFRNCDVIRAGNTACDIQNGDFAFIHDVIFYDIRVEIDKEHTEHVYQSSFEEEYPKIARYFPVFLLKIFNRQFNTANFKAHDLALFGDRAATVDNIVAKNITVYLDKDLPTADGKYNCAVDITSHVKGKRYGKITIENVVINGAPVLYEDLLAMVSDTDEFVWKK